MTRPFGVDGCSQGLDPEMLGIDDPLLTSQTFAQMEKELIKKGKDESQCVRDTQSSKAW